MEQRDLEAIAAYVKTIPAVSHRIPKSTFVASTMVMPGEIAAGEGTTPTASGTAIAFDNNGMPGDAGVVIPDHLPTPTIRGPLSISGNPPPNTTGSAAGSATTAATPTVDYPGSAWHSNAKTSGTYGAQSQKSP
jgi:hypothetical protein